MLQQGLIKGENRMARIAKLTAMIAALTTTTAVVCTKGLSDIGIVVVYDQVDGSGAGNMTVKGTFDTDHTIEYIPAITPTLSTSIDADGVIAYTTDETTYYNVAGVHEYLKITWTESANQASASIYIMGVED